MMEHVNNPKHFIFSILIHIVIDIFFVEQFRSIHAPNTNTLCQTLLLTVTW